MGDNNEDLDLGEGDTSGGDASPRKGGGLGALLPNLLKYVALGLGAIIFIATVSVITGMIMNKGGDEQTVRSATEAYEGKKPVLSYRDIGQIRTTTNDETPRSVLVKIQLGYDKDSKEAQNELTERDPEIKDALRSFFSKKTAADLSPSKEEEVKAQLKELLNSDLLNESQIREVIFLQFDVVSM